MTNIFLIGAEHQLFQVDIAISHFRIEKKSIILIIEKVSNNHKFIDKVNNSNVYGEVIIFESWTFKDLFRNPYKHQFFINLCLSFVNKEIFFFASHYDSDSTLLFNSIVKPSKYFLMDEGTASFSVQIQRNSFEFRTKLKVFIKSLFYKKQISLPKELMYFTKFELDLPKNDQKVIYKVEKNNNPLTLLNQEELIFIGSSIVEMKMIEEIAYINCLAKVVVENKEKISKFYYYPHRKECVEKLDKIIKLGFEIRYLEEPFEPFFNKQIEISSIICSFYTTSVIYNIAASNNKFPKLIIYKFDNSLLKTDRLVYENIYKAMKTNKLINFSDI
jgi:hypothetical protein